MAIIKLKTQRKLFQLIAIKIFAALLFFFQLSFNVNPSLIHRFLDPLFSRNRITRSKCQTLVEVRTLRILSKKYVCFIFFFGSVSLLN